MNPPTQLVASYWSLPVLEVNLLVFANLLGALLLGLLVGYERAYHGRAAGMRTYGIVCMASAALTVFAGYPSYWWGEMGTINQPGIDPTRIVQGIVTGVGFLGAGVIMKEGFTISGLTTAASIWAASAIGILVGIGFYPAAILLSLLSASLMMWGPRLEARLPSRRALGVMLTFDADHEPQEADFQREFQRWGYTFAMGSVHVTSEGPHLRWQFVMVAVRSRPEPTSLFELSRLLRQLPGVKGLQISFARN